MSKKVKCEACDLSLATAYSRMSDRFVCDDCLLAELLDRADVSSDVNLLPVGGITEKERPKYEM